ncbi:DUF429 domain-containing protein [Streptomyces sp. HNM0645]|uniref:DUF429 domain-containing protein n=1 Tax=Streptomyces sp. HNM0645 TaxID=2782343 RepID=UPI0024B79CE1|nr:DUF429 domain-containing protein [Streptomyces sp. HNM0645]MDI9886446.1 DUF429 domain-containing protein [Streptomyces sp. HNM0645]
MGDVVRVLGVDACPGGWVSVALRDGRFDGARFAADLRSLLGARAPQGGTEDGGEAGVVAVDIPLGLLETGWRRADAAAAALLGRRRGSVFRVPPRAVWQEERYEAANHRCRELTGAGLSRQSWGLAAKLREANACLAEAGGERLREVHPEVSFRALAGGRPLSYRKKSWAGQMVRRGLLREAGVVLPDELGGAGSVPPDDVLDAAAAAWSADRIARGRARSLPDPPQLGDRDRPIAIWY